MKKKPLMYLLIILVFLSDRIVKISTESVHTVLIPGIVNINAVRNTGISFGILQGSAVVISLITFTVITVMILYAHRKLQTYPGHIAFGLIIGGACGNLFDRTVYGYVMDMIDLQFIDFFVFNIADCAVVIGAILLAIYLLFFMKDCKND